MGLNGIEKFLEKIKNITPPEIFGRVYVKNGVKNYTGIDLDIKKIKISTKEGCVYIKTTPAEKNIIFLNKEKIINFLKEKMGEKSPKEIR